MNYKIGDRLFCHRGFRDEHPYIGLKYKIHAIVGNSYVLSCETNNMYETVDLNNNFELWYNCNKFEIGDSVKMTRKKSSNYNKIGRIINVSDGRYIIPEFSTEFSYSDNDLVLCELTTKEVPREKYIKDDIDSISYLTEKINRHVLGQWNVENPQGGEKKMNRIVELYRDRKMDEIGERYESLIEIEKNKKSELETTMLEIIANTSKTLEDLYMSQFSEEELKDMSIGLGVDMSDKDVIRTDSTLFSAHFRTNSEFNKEALKELLASKDKEKSVVHELCREVEAALSIIGENETDKINEVLVRYNIIDKKTLKVKI